jgi:hypothetical protein
MRHVQGYPGCHWTPPLGGYLLCIAPAASRATANNTTTKKWTNYASHFDGHGGAIVQYCVHCPMEEVQGFGISHWMPPSGKYCGEKMQSVTHMPVFFELFHRKLFRKRSRVYAKAPVFNKGMTYQTKEKGLTKVSILFIGGIRLVK